MNHSISTVSSHVVHVDFVSVWSRTVMLIFSNALWIMPSTCTRLFRLPKSCSGGCQRDRLRRFSLWCNIPRPQGRQSFDGRTPKDARRWGLCLLDGVVSLVKQQANNHRRRDCPGQLSVAPAQPEVEQPSIIPLASSQSRAKQLSIKSVAPNRSQAKKDTLASVQPTQPAVKKLTRASFALMLPLTTKRTRESHFAREEPPPTSPESHYLQLDART